MVELGHSFDFSMIVLNASKYIFLLTDVPGVASQWVVPQAESVVAAVVDLSSAVCGLVVAAVKYAWEDNIRWPFLWVWMSQ